MANLEHKNITGDDAYHPLMPVQSSDPGAIGANKFWLDTTGGATLTAGAILKQRDASDTGWTTRADVKTALDLKAALASPTFTGTPVAPTAAAATNTTQLATTAFVQQEIAAKAPLASPTFTGTPAAPTAAGGTNTTQLATTAFVTAAVAAAGTGIAVTLIDAKGDLIAGSAADTAARLAVGTDGYSLVADSTQTTGLKWDPRYTTIGIVIDGGGSAITTGVKGYLPVDFAGTIVSATALADQSGSIVVDIWKDSYANYPPVDADSITASAPVTISAATKATDSTLTGWTTTFAAGDVFGFNVDSASTVTRVTIALKVRRT